MNRSEDLREFLDVLRIINKRIAHRALEIVVELQRAHAAHLDFGAWLGFRTVDQLVGQHRGGIAEVDRVPDREGLGRARLDVTGHFRGKAEACHVDLADLSAVVSCGVNDSARLEVERLTAELESLRAVQPADQDSVLAGLREQVETLNAANLSLLEDKDQMASQLLRLNAVVSDMSQQVDPEEINVTGLNNERRNTILAANSSEGQDFNASMKKQINELVREIDKCIALLSA